MSIFGDNPFRQAKEGKFTNIIDEGNMFSGALKSAKEKGEKTFTVAGKTYDVESRKLISKEDNTNKKSDDGEGMDKVQPKAVKKKFKDRIDKDIDNDGDVDSSDKYLHKRRKAVSKAIKKEEDNPANRQHLCATNVVHEKWGKGQCLPQMHATPTKEGHVEWYDVMFEHGIETKVSVNEMKVVAEKNHGHMKKTKKKDEQVTKEMSSKEKMKKGLYNK